MESEYFSKLLLLLLKFDKIEIDESESWLKKCWAVVRRILVAAIFYINIGSVGEIVLFINDFGAMMAAILCLLFSLYASGFEIILFFYADAISAMFQQYIMILDESSYSVFDMKKAFRDASKLDFRNSSIRYLMMIIIVACLSSIYFISNLIWSTKYFFLTIWTIVDTSNQAIFLGVFAIESVALFGSVVMNIAQEVVLCTLMRFQITHAQYLCANLTYILDIANTQPQIAYQNLLAWIQHHQKFLINENKLRKLFSPILLFNYLIIFSFVFAAAISMIKPTLESFQKLGAFVYAIIYLLVLKRLCSMSEHLQELNQKLLRCSFRSSGLFNGRRMANTLLLIQTRNSKYRQLSAYGLYPLSDETFGLLLKATFSYSVTIMQLQDSNPL